MHPGADDSFSRNKEIKSVVSGSPLPCSWSYLVHSDPCGLTPVMGSMVPTVDKASLRC